MKNLVLLSLVLLTAYSQIIKVQSLIEYEELVDNFQGTVIVQFDSWTCELCKENGYTLEQMSRMDPQNVKVVYVDS